MRSTIKTVGKSPFINMGVIRLRQPLPSQYINQIDPFILLHHYGPYKISEDNNPFNLGPHPHRGFEPITFMIQGEQWHRDSLGNESLVTSGDVQWTTAGNGIIHAEAPAKDFVKRGGVLEGIQLWLNLPSEKKMMPAHYQHIKKEEFQVVSSKDTKVNIQVIAGSLESKYGKIKTQTSVNVYMIDAVKHGVYRMPLDASHQSLVYLIEGEAHVNDTVLKVDENQLLEFNQDGNHFVIQANTDSKLLFLSGAPLLEPVVTYGPYVMNTQTEIMEAMRDYKEGKMGFLPIG